MRYFLYYFSKERIEIEGYLFVESYLNLNECYTRIGIDKPVGYRIEKSDETLTEIIEENGEVNG